MTFRSIYLALTLLAVLIFWADPAAYLTEVLILLVAVVAGVVRYVHYWLHVMATAIGTEVAKFLFAPMRRF